MKARNAPGLSSPCLRTQTSATDRAFRNRALSTSVPTIDGVIMPPPTNPDRVLALELLPGAWDGVRGPVEKAQQKSA